MPGADRMSPRELREVRMVAVVIGLHALGFHILIALAVPHHHGLGAWAPATVGMGGRSPRSFHR